jgi:hypothetical protein
METNSLKGFLDYESSFWQTWRLDKNNTKLKMYFSRFEKKFYIKFLHSHPPQGIFCGKILFDDYNIFHLQGNKWKGK